MRGHREGLSYTLKIPVLNILMIILLHLHVYDLKHTRKSYIEQQINRTAHLRKERGKHSCFN